MDYTFTSIYRPVSKDFFDLAKSKFLVAKEKVNSHLFQYKNWPQEDSFSFSKKFPVFCVTDGVTLDPKIENGYPNPSGAFLVADIFAKTFVKVVEKKIKNFNLKILKSIFDLGNKEAGKINKRYGRLKNKINYLDFDLFAATAGMAIIVESKLFWGTIADSFVAVFNKNGQQKFCSPDGWRYFHLSKYLPETEKKIYIRKKLRNGFTNNEKIGYGVITGEAKAVKYLDYGIQNLQQGDIILIGTDGFVDYLQLPEFVNVVVNLDKNTNAKLLKLENKLIKSNPSKYGHERTLIIVKIRQ